MYPDSHYSVHFLPMLLITEYSLLPLSPTGIKRDYYYLEAHSPLSYISSISSLCIFKGAQKNNQLDDYFTTKQLQRSEKGW